MSWDILIINSNKPIDFEKDNWNDFKSRQSVIDSIKQTFPESNWDDLSWGVLNNDKAVIEFNMGSKENLEKTFMLHVRGGQDPTGEIAKMCEHHGWIAFDISGEQFLDKIQPSAESFNKWESYRNQVVSKVTQKKPWWKIW